MASYRQRLKSRTASCPKRWSLLASRYDRSFPIAASILLMFLPATSVGYDDGGCNFKSAPWPYFHYISHRSRSDALQHHVPGCCLVRPAGKQLRTLRAVHDCLRGKICNGPIYLVAAAVIPLFAGTALPVSTAGETDVRVAEWSSCHDSDT